MAGDGFRNPNARRPTIFLGAIVHIQLFWRNKLLLIRAREERKKEREDLEREERSAFDLLAPTRRVSRSRVDFVAAQIEHSNAQGSTQQPIDIPPSHEPSRYHAREISGEDQSSTAATPQATSIDGALVVVPATNGDVGPSASPSSPLQTKRSGHADSGSTYREGNHNAPAIMTVESAANIIKFFIHARCLLWRLRDQRRARDKQFLLWESDAFRALASFKETQQPRAPRQQRSNHRKAPEDAVSPAVADPQPSSELSTSPPRRPSPQYDALLEKLVCLKDELRRAAAGAEQQSSTRSGLDKEFAALQHTLRNIVEAYPTAAERSAAGTKTGDELDESQFELFADTATDLCIDIQALLDTAAGASSPQPPAPAVATPQEMTIDDVDNMIRNSEERALNEHIKEVELEQTNVQQQHEIVNSEMIARADLVQQRNAKHNILVGSFFEGGLAWLVSSESDSRSSTVTRTEAAARKVLRDVRDITEAHLRARHRAALTIQCWLRSARARRMHRIKAQRCQHVMLMRIAKEDELERELQQEVSDGDEQGVVFPFGAIDAAPSQTDSPQSAVLRSTDESKRHDGSGPRTADDVLNSSLSIKLNALQRSVAATAIQRIARGRLARRHVKRLTARLNSVLNAADAKELQQTKAATTISAFFLSLAAQRQLQAKQQAVADLIARNEAADVLNSATAVEADEQLGRLTESTETTTRRRDAAALTIALFFRSLVAQRLRRAKQLTVAELIEQNEQLDQLYPAVDGALQADATEAQQAATTIDIVSTETQDRAPSPTPVEEQPSKAEATQRPSTSPFNAVPAPPSREPSARPVRQQYQSAAVPVAPPPGEQQRPMSARVPSTRPTQPSSRRPTTASPRKRATAEGGPTPYVDGCHDSKTALRTLSASPLFTLPVGGRTAQSLYGRLVSGELAVSPNEIVDVDDDDGVDDQLISPVKWGGTEHNAPNHSSKVAAAAASASSEFSKPPAMPTARPPTAPTNKEPEYLNYVGMLEVLKKSIIAGILHGGRSNTVAGSSDGIGSNPRSNPTILHGDLLDIVLARRGTSTEAPMSSTAPIAAAIKRQSLTVLELDAAIIRSPVAGGSNPLEIRHTGELSDLWKSDVFLDRVVQRLHLLAAPSTDTAIYSYCFCLDEVAIAILSSIDTIATVDHSIAASSQRLPPFIAKTQLIEGVPGMMLYEGQPVADREEFEIFCGVFVSTCKLLAEERRTVDAATVAACFTILDVHRGRMLPRGLFDSVFKLRLPLSAAHKGGVPFLAFASALRRNMVHTPMTCQKVMGTFFEKELLKGNSVALGRRLQRVCRLEEQLRNLSTDLLDALATVGERAGASLGDALVLYTALGSSSAASQIRWFALSFLATLYNQFSVQAMKGLASLPQLIQELIASPDTAPAHKRALSPPSPALESAAGEQQQQRSIDAVWEDIIRVFASLVESSTFIDALRLQKQCDGTSGRRNVYRTRASDSEELDRCVPWSTLSLPCVDSLNFFAAQRVSFDAELTAKLQVDAEGLIVRRTHYVDNDGSGADTSARKATQERQDDDGSVRQWLATHASQRLATTHIRFFCSSASAHVNGFEARRSQWNSLLYTLRHYSICLTEVFALQFMDRSVTHLPPPTRRAVTQQDAQRQLLVTMATHPDLLKSYPLRLETPYHYHHHSHEAPMSFSTPKLFTNRFAKMLFTLSVQRRESVEVRQAWNTPMTERHPASPISSSTPRPNPLASPDDTPLPIQRPSSRALHQYAAAAGSPLNSRPTSAASTGSASSLHRNHSGASTTTTRPGASDICSPPSRSSTKPPQGAVPVVATAASSTPQSTPYFGAAAAAAAARSSSGSSPKRTHMMQQIMGSFRGIQPLLPASAAAAASSQQQQQRAVTLPQIHQQQQQQPRPATTTAATPPSASSTVRVASQQTSPFSGGGGGRPQVLLSQRVADLLSHASNASASPNSSARGGSASGRPGVYPAFRGTHSH